MALPKGHTLPLAAKVVPAEQLFAEHQHLKMFGILIFDQI